MEQLILKGISLNRYLTTEEWNQSDYIPQAGEQIIYSDAFQDKEGIQVPGIKVGNGLSIAKDLPFTSGNNSEGIDLSNIDLIGQGGSQLISQFVAGFGRYNTVGQKAFKLNAQPGEELPKEWVQGDYYEVTYDPVTSSEEALLSALEELEHWHNSGAPLKYSVRIRQQFYNCGLITGVDIDKRRIKVNFVQDEPETDNPNDKLVNADGGFIWTTVLPVISIVASCDGELPKSKPGSIAP